MYANAKGTCGVRPDESRQFSLAEKLFIFPICRLLRRSDSFIVLSGSDVIDSSLAAYVYAVGFTKGMLAGSLIVALIYLPTLVYFVKERKFAAASDR